MVGSFFSNCAAGGAQGSPRVSLYMGEWNGVVGFTMWRSLHLSSLLPSFFRGYTKRARARYVSVFLSRFSDFGTSEVCFCLSCVLHGVGSDSLEICSLRLFSAQSCSSFLAEFVVPSTFLGHARGFLLCLLIASLGRGRPQGTIRSSSRLLETPSFAGW